MSTRSGIGINVDGTIKAIYCHSDGYLEYNGAILNQYYRNSGKVTDLIAQGDMSSLGLEIGIQIDFDDRMEYDTINDFARQCRFYQRDRGETGCDAQSFNSRHEFVEGYPDCEYFYVMEDGVWYVSNGRAWRRLSEAMDEIASEDSV